VGLPDGRQVAYAVIGDPHGIPVVCLHGTPGSARQLAALDGPARAHGVALVTPDRAGYGRSTHDPARSIASNARDVEAVLRSLGVDSCSVIGLSGGGPFALGCGVVLAGQVTAVATVGGVAPMVPRDPSLPPDRLVGRVARRSEACTRALFALMLHRGRAHPERTLEQFASLLAESDARLLHQAGPVRTAFLDDFRHPSATAARAAARDFWLFEHAWDVCVADMAVPCDIWHGTQDRNVPAAHARVIARRCPSARLHLVDGGGHMLLGELEEILSALLAR
jgi:pimeloyl-ACP methyl ester carboxylesterase